MSKPYDAALKELIEAYPADWLPFVGLPTSAPVEVTDADVSTITAAADKVLRVEEAPPWLLHLELQSSPKSGLAEYLHWYNALLGHRHRMRVRTVLVLLRPSADSPALNGVYEQQFPSEPPYLQFRYRVVRVWQVPAENLLTGALGTLPLAPISAVEEARLPDVVRRIDERLAREGSPGQTAILGAAAILLTGLRLPLSELVHLYQGVGFMSILEDSSAVELFLAKGRAQGALQELKKTLLRQGRKQFGPPDEAAVAELEAITDLERLERMSERLLDVSAWADLLATP